MLLLDRRTAWEDSFADLGIILSGAAATQAATSLLKLSELRSSRLGGDVQNFVKRWQACWKCMYNEGEAKGKRRKQGLYCRYSFFQQLRTLRIRTRHLARFVSFPQLAVVFITRVMHRWSRLLLLLAPPLPHRHFDLTFLLQPFGVDAAAAVVVGLSSSPFLSSVGFLVGGEAAGLVPLSSSSSLSSSLKPQSTLHEPLVASSEVHLYSPWT